MSDTQHSHTPEKLQSSELSAPNSISDGMSTTETLIPVDAAPTEASLPGFTDKDSTNSPTLGSSESSHGDKAVGAHLLLHRNRPGKKKYVDDPLLKVHLSETTSKYAVPEDIRPLDSYPRGYPRIAASLDCNANFTIYRKYGWLHNRSLLHLQAELARLEFDLQLLDDEQAEECISKNGEDLGAMPWTKPGERKSLQRSR